MQVKAYWVVEEGVQWVEYTGVVVEEKKTMFIMLEDMVDVVVVEDDMSIMESVVWGLYSM